MKQWIAVGFSIVIADSPLTFLTNPSLVWQREQVALFSYTCAPLAWTEFDHCPSAATIAVLLIAVTAEAIRRLRRFLDVRDRAVARGDEHEADDHHSETDPFYPSSSWSILQVFETRHS